MIPQGWGYYLKSATITVATSTNYASTTVGYLYSDKYSNVDLGSNGGNGVIFTFKNSDYIGKRLTPNTKYYYKVNAFISGIPYPDVERSNFVFTTGDFITF